MRTILAAATAMAILGAGLVPGLVSGAAHAQDTGAYGGEPSHIERKAPTPREADPIERKDYDKAVAKLFRQGDTNGDGTITLAELNAAIDARKTDAISKRFGEIDADHDKSLSFAEFVAWQHSIGAAALSDGATAAAGTEGMVAEEIAPDPGRSPQDETIARVLAPLNSVLLVGANTDYDAGASLAELTAYEDKRFNALDTNHDGWLTVGETRSLDRPDGAPSAPGGSPGMRGAGGPPPGTPPHG